MFNQYQPAFDYELIKNKLAKYGNAVLSVSETNDIKKFCIDKLICPGYTNFYWLMTTQFIEIINNSFDFWLNVWKTHVTDQYIKDRDLSALKYKLNEAFEIYNNFDQDKAKTLNYDKIYFNSRDDSFFIPSKKILDQLNFLNIKKISDGHYSFWTTHLLLPENERLFTKIINSHINIDFNYEISFRFLDIMQHGYVWSFYYNNDNTNNNNDHESNDDNDKKLSPFRNYIMLDKK